MATSSTIRFHLEQSAKIAAAYVSNNRVPAIELPVLVQRLHDTISALTSGIVISGDRHAAMPEIEQPSAAEIERSIRPDGIVSFLDGRTYKTLKRHLTSHGLDPKSYRIRYGLPADYPMIAEEYRERRSALAIQIRLGRAAQ